MSTISPALPDAPFSLHDALQAIDRAETSLDRITVAAEALRAIQFARVVISMRDASLNPTHSVNVGDDDAPDSSAPDLHELKPLPGAVWRRRLAGLEPFRQGELFMLDGSDRWVAREFFGSQPSDAQAVGVDGATWLPTDLLIALLHGADNELLGIVKLARPRNGQRPSETITRDVAAITRHLAARLGGDVYRDLARQRALRLQRLQEAGAAFARLLDEHAIVRELARQALRATSAEGVTVTAPRIEDDVLVTTLAITNGVEQTRGPTRLGEGMIFKVARTGMPLRTGDRLADRARERTGELLPLSMRDVLGEQAVAASVLAVPMLATKQLVGVLAVHAVATDVFGDEDEEVLATLASQAATAIANARRYDESERDRRQTEALADVARAVGESLRLGDVLRLILRHAVALLGGEGACIALRHDEYLHIVAAVGCADVLAGVHLPVATSLMGRAVTSNDIVVSNDVSVTEPISPAVSRLTSVDRIVIAPMMTAQETIGAISVLNRDIPFTPDDARVLQRLSDHVAVAIVNARLFEEIERATREWKVAFDSIASGMVVLDDRLVVRRCNARAAELCAMTIQELLGRRFREALLGTLDSTSAAVDELALRAITESQPVREIVRDDRRGRLFQMNVSPHPDGGCVLTFDDVTDVHRLMEQHRSVLETVSDAIVITGLDGVISFANSAAHALFRTSDVVGQHSAQFVEPGSLAEIRRRERAAKQGSSQHYECYVRCADGTALLVSVSSAPQFELGKLTGIVASLRDIGSPRAPRTALA